MTTLPDLEPALEPFTTFARESVEKTDSGWQWSSGLGRDRICDWFGPSDFGLLAHFAEALAARSVPEAGKAVDRREAMQLAIDYLKETKHGSPARSAGHNARLVLEAALASVPAPSGAEQTSREVGWLIERKYPVNSIGSTEPRWYAERPNGDHWWTPVPNEAKRFTSKAEAEAYPAYQMIASVPTISLTEHVFLATPQAAPAEEIAARRALSGASE